MRNGLDGFEPLAQYVRRVCREHAPRLARIRGVEVHLYQRIVHVAPDAPKRARSQLD